MKLAAAFTVCSAVVLHPAMLSTQQPGPTTQAGSYVYQGTVRTVETRARTLTVVTGVGLALQVVRIRLAPDSRLERAGAALAVSDLKPGDVVRAECRLVQGALVAERIEKLEVPR
ncbi:MAG: hypothetical protein ACREL9_05130 [Gemmatimonadales bacterium]